MGTFANVYAGHQCIYGENAYHPADIEVVDFGKLFRLQIDQELSKEQKLKGERKAVIEATEALSFEHAMQIFLDINNALYGKKEFYLNRGLDSGSSAIVQIGTLSEWEQLGVLATVPDNCEPHYMDIKEKSELIISRYNRVLYNLTSRLSGASVDEVAMQLEKIDDLLEKRLRIK